VVFHAEAGLRAEGQTVHVRVTTGDGSVVYDQDNPVAGGGAGTLASVPLIPAGGDASRTFEVFAELSGAGGVLSEVRVVGGYVSKELREIHAWFDDDCRGVSCGDGRTCERGVCLGACYESAEPETTERSTPSCGECEDCLGGSCAPRPDGSECGCATTDQCAGGACITSEPIAAVSGGHLHSCAAVRGGSLYCWGSNRVGQLGTGGSATSLPEEVMLGAIADGSAATDHTCWLQFTGTRYCWGWRGNGQMGDGTMDGGRVDTPQEEPAGEPEWAKIATGWFTNCALSATGEIWCWGTNMGGGCGVDPALENPVVFPTLVSDTLRFTDVAFGGFHGCGIADDRTLWCWGLNGSGELGIGDSEDRFEPTQSGCTEDECFDDWVSVGAGSFHTCAIREGGRLYCWGGALNGQLGIGVLPERGITRPAEVEGRWRAVAAGESHTCAIAEDESLWCWGKNQNGQLGLGDLDRREAPTRVTVPGGDGFLRLGLGREHTCVIRRDETLWCWGWNEDGQIGQGFETPAGDLPVSSPRRVCFPG